MLGAGLLFSGCVELRSTTSRLPVNVDSLFAPFAAKGRPGASVLVLRNDSVLVRASFGLADVENNLAVSPSTNFRLASLTKEFTATAVLLLIRQRKLGLDTPLTDVLPTFPPYGRAIHIRHLLSHTSGVWDYEDFVPDTQQIQVHDADVLKLLRSKTESTYFAPGSAYRYSNSGFALLALVVEKVSQRRFADFLRTEIFAPSGMEATVAFENGISTVTQRAFGYTVKGDSVTRTDQSPTSAVLGDGGVYSSIDDMGRWIRALESNVVLRADEWKAATTPMTLADGSTSEYGFGWFIDVVHGHRRLRHHGETIGFTNSIQLFPDDRIAIVILTNRTDAAPWKLAENIALSLVGA
jgi:CubicO group peptidase (beta-lactamase class C family)